MMCLFFNVEFLFGFVSFAVNCFFLMLSEMFYRTHFF